MRQLVSVIIIALSACAPDYNTTHEEPVAGSVAVIQQELSFRSCTQVMAGLDSKVVYAVWSANTIQARGRGDIWETGKPSGIIVSNGFPTDQKPAARCQFCQRMSGKRVENRSTVPWRQANLTDTIVSCD